MDGIEPVSVEILADLLDKERKERKDNLLFAKIVTVIFAGVAGITIGITHGVLAGLIAVTIPPLMVGGANLLLHFSPN